MFEEASQKRRMVYTMLLFLPLALAVAWLAYLKLTTEAVGIGAGTFFSPLENKPIIVGLVIFALGYLFFLGMMFSTNIRNMLTDYRRRRELQ